MGACMSHTHSTAQVVLQQCYRHAAFSMTSAYFTNLAARVVCAARKQRNDFGTSSGKLLNVP